MPAAPNASQQESKNPVHKHPHDGTYYFGCRACREADDKRRGLNAPKYTDEQVEKITFFLPSDDYCHTVCRQFIDRRYPDAPFKTQTIDLQQIGQWEPDETIVVVRRVPRPAQPLGPGWERAQDKEGRWETRQVPADRYFDEVVESEPVPVRELLIVERGNRFTRATTSNRRLLDALSDLCASQYRLSVPRTEKDSILSIVRC